MKPNTQSTGAENRLAAAQALGVHKTTLFRKIRALGIEPTARDGRSRTRDAGSR